MKIERLSKLKENKYLTVRDLNSGDVFVYDNNVKDVYLQTDSDSIVNLETGELIDPYGDEELQYSSIRKISAKVIVQDDENEQ